VCCVGVCCIDACAQQCRSVLVEALPGPLSLKGNVGGGLATKAGPFLTTQCVVFAVPFLFSQSTHSHNT